MDCCIGIQQRQQNCLAAKRVRISITKASRIVRNYHKDFRLRRKFQVRILGGGGNLPPFHLEQNKDVCTAMQQYAREHLSELSVELMCQFLDETVLPKMVKTGIEKGEFVTEEYEIEVEKLLREYRLTSIIPSTVY